MVDVDEVVPEVSVVAVDALVVVVDVDEVVPVLSVVAAVVVFWGLSSSWH